MDAVIMNFDIKLESFISKPRGPDKFTYDISFSEDLSGINTGVFLSKNSKWTKDFLRLAFAQNQFDDPQSQLYPFK